MTAYYNEIDSYAAQWLRNLIEAGHIAPGYVDERSIEDVYPSDLRGFTQCHFFAGIGVWSHALRSAGWRDDRPVWTGSCPCQPFSAAGSGAGFDDQRHLWPAFFHLIEQCRPAAIFGEQVASKDANPWIDLVQTDMEAVGYGVGAVAFPSASIGAPHIRDRLYWMANAGSKRLEKREWKPGISIRKTGANSRQAVERGDICATIGLGHADSERAGRNSRGLRGAIDRKDGQHCADNANSSGADGRMADSIGVRCIERRIGEPTEKCDGLARDGSYAPRQPAAGPTNGFWEDADWLYCRDGKWRPVEPGTFPLVNGASSRVGRLRAYGNAINAKAAQAFIECMMEAA